LRSADARRDCCVSARAPAWRRWLLGSEDLGCARSREGGVTSFAYLVFGTIAVLFVCLALYGAGRQD
jgi:hypothetical protein